MSEITKIKCKDCPFYSGIQCHGHGEYWGECLLFKIIKPCFYPLVAKDALYSLVPQGGDVWKKAIFEDSECLFFDLEVL